MFSQIPVHIYPSVLVLQTFLSIPENTVNAKFKIQILPKKNIFLLYNSALKPI